MVMDIYWIQDSGAGARDGSAAMDAPVNGLVAGKPA
jgi:hypothetical protein